MSIIPGLNQDSFIMHMEVALKANYTDEQKEFIKAFGDSPVFCFASPGTGKTFTAVGGLLNAELFKGIPADKMCAISFTNMSTGELAVRHQNACRKLEIVQNVKFSTLHSLCSNILSRHYMLLGMNAFGNAGKLPLEKSVKIIEDASKSWNLEQALDPMTIKRIVRACETLNASLIFDEDNVRSKMDYKICNVDYDIFEAARGTLMSYSLLTNKVEVQDILLYTLMLMQKHPELSQEFKQQYQLLLVDEAQDLSLLHLRVISMLTDNPVFIGDIKQQIYGFNGACPQIADRFFQHFPNAKSLKLTQSFRCRNEIADFATRTIIPNDVGGEDFKGIGGGGEVSIHCGYDSEGLDLQTIVDNLKHVYVQNMNTFPESILFLFRNNASVIPIAEALFQREVPFRVNKYTEAYAIPVMKEACELLQFCADPRTPANVAALQYIIPELIGYSNIQYNPYYQIMIKTGKSAFEVNYSFKDPAAREAMNMLFEVKEAMDGGAPVKDLINMLWPIYTEEYLKKNAWKYDNDVNYYINSVTPLVHKTYKQFVQDELNKVNIISECNRYQRGVRCYTMHASKGLEADIVYIVDADDGLIPNTKKLDRLVKAHCDLDAARNVREERSLVYVACTRAKKELHIVHNGKLSPMFTGGTEYKMYDDVYRFNRDQGDDIVAYEHFVQQYIEPYMY